MRPVQYLLNRAIASSRTYFAIIDAPYPGLSVHISGLYSMPVAGAGRP